MRISLERDNSILMEDLEHVSFEIVVYQAVDHQHTRGHLSQVNLNVLEAGHANYLQRFGSIDETWVHHFSPEANQQS